MDLEIDVSEFVKKFDRYLTNFQHTQMPFATALALTRTAQLVKKGEVEEIEKTFDKPTPFTKRGVGIVPAKKNNLVAEVFVKDIQAAYLEPYAFGGRSIPAKPGEVAMLTPKAIGLNTYGNIPYQKIKKLLGNKAKYFIGTVNTKNGGNISGVWERTVNKKAQPVKFDPAKNKFTSSAGPLRGLKLLVRFTDPITVKKHLDYFARAQKIVSQNFTLELKKALRVAMASAK